jgi:hypothetical protein
MRYLEEKKDERAARAAERALRLDLTRAQREMMLHVGCVSRLRLGQLEGAFAYCDAAVEAGGPRHWAHLVNRGNVHLENGDQQAALADFEAASLWLAENEVAGEPAERVRVAMQWAQPAPPASQLAVEDSPR